MHSVWQSQYTHLTAAKMMPLCWAMLLVCCYSNSEGTIIIKEPGESIILKCSTDKCTKSNDGHIGMYLYHTFTKEKEVYYYPNYTNNKIMARLGYTGRIRMNGSLMSHNITINNLTVDDSGIYACVYKESVDKSVGCNRYTVFVRGLPPCPIQETQTTEELSSLTVVLIIGTCVISMLLITIFILMIIQRMKQRSSCRRAAQSSQQESNDYVYEVMTKNNLYHVVLSE